MGQRLNKKKSAKQKNLLNRQKNSTLSTKKQSTKLPVTIEQKNDTIKEIDFFGFPPSVFAKDLQTTGWATAVILVILGLIVLVTKR